MIDGLYNTAVLTLAAGIPHIGKLDNPQGTASCSARLCGSRITVYLNLDEQQKVTEFAQTVKACALGQAAAAILGKNIIGASTSEILDARNALWSMLKEQKPMPAGRFDELQKLSEVSKLPQRHTSTCLAFDAAIAACEQAINNSETS